MVQYTITPTVDQAREFIEIANDFSNPLDLVREAISNSYDAMAKNIHILTSVIKQAGEDVLEIQLIDDGQGMDKGDLQAFFDLGNSTRRVDSSAIGEKGHGTKVYFNSRSIQVKTTKNGTTLEAKMAEPKKNLFEGKLPTVIVTEAKTPRARAGTAITISGYNNNKGERFNHERLKDHVLWFTKHGSVESIFGINVNNKVKLRLKGVDRNEPETIAFGHVFPEENKGRIEALKQAYGWRAFDYYCKRIVKTDRLPLHPHIEYQLVFSLEGNRVKYAYNPMISRQGLQAPAGAYRVQERYGLWLCKDSIPIEQKNEWVVERGLEFTRLHAFFNCQGFSLTANRGSVENTPSEIMRDIEQVVRSAYQELNHSDDWVQWDTLEEYEQAGRGMVREEKALHQRIIRANRANIAKHKGHVLVEPTRESGVFALVVQLELLEPTLLPFKIIDYDTYSGIDAIVKSDRVTPVRSSELYYVEFKHTLTNEFNHSFKNTHSIVCWDTEVKHGGIVRDISGEIRKLTIAGPQGKRMHTRYSLPKRGSPRTIEVYVLKYYLKERLDAIEFRPRTDKDCV